MRSILLNKVTLAILGVVIVCLGAYAIVKIQKKEIVPEVKVEVVSPDPRIATIGKSVQGRVIESFTYGQGEKELLFVGGIHGGYEWNSVLLAYKLIDYLNEKPESVPTNLTVTVIPSANPDGVYKVTGKEGRFLVTDVKEDLPSGTGRFNTNNVDLNRNFDCKWQEKSTWRGNVVSAGTSAFSEPEALAIKDLISQNNFSAAIFFHSQSNAIYASACDNGILPGTRAIMNAYATASGYTAVDVFDSYVVTGAVEDWLASIGIPAITVELKTHEAIEWEKNLLGIEAIFEHFNKN